MPGWLQPWLADHWGVLLAGCLAIACAWLWWRGARLGAAHRALDREHQQLAESEGRYRLLLELAGEGVWLFDPAGNTIFANPAMERMLGCDTLQRRSLFDFVYPEALAAARERLRLRIAGDRAQREFRWRRADGEPVESLISTSVLRDAQGQVIGLMGVVIDISERVRIDRELTRLNRDLGLRVEERTRELEESNRELAREIVVREYVQVELAASNERLNHYVHELRKHTGDITRLNQLADALHASNTHAELIAALSAYCREGLGCDGGVLYEWHDEQLQVLEGAWGCLEGLGPVFLGGAQAALQQGQLLPAAPTEHSLELAAADPAAPFNLCMPLRARERAAGALVLTRRGSFWSGDPVTDRRLEQILLALADHVALAMANLNLVEQLREQSFSDALTGLYNRRYFYEQIGREIALWGRQRQPFALMMIDIDHFKSFNDRYGHNVGDEVLVQVAKLLHRHTRRSDSACRLGGEEFVVLMPGAEQQLALERAELIRTEVKALRIEGTPVGESVSISVGVAVYPQHGEGSNALMRAADEALYESKRCGRDRISLAGGN